MKLPLLTILAAFSISSALFALEDDFSDATKAPAGLLYEGANHFHEAVRTGGELNLRVKKRNWDGWMISFAQPLDLSAAPRVSLKLRSPARDVFVRIYAVEDIVAGKYAATPNSEVEVIQSAAMNDYAFDFAGVQKVDLTKVKGLLVNFNPGSDFEGEVVMDDLKIGGNAERLPAVTMPERLVLPLGSKPVSVRVHDIRPQGLGDSVEVAAGTSDAKIVGPPQISRKLDVRAADLVITPLALGRAKVLVKAKAGGFEKRVSMDVEVVPNRPPTLDEIAGVDLAGARTLRVTGVTDGDPDVRQRVIVSAVSSNPSLVTAKAVYRSEGKEASLPGEARFALVELTAAKGASGEANVTVTAKDDGGTVSGGNDTFTRTFAVRVFPSLNAPPVVDDLLPQTFDASDEAPRRVYVGGLDNGEGSPAGLTLTASSSNPTLLSNPEVEFRPGDSHAFLVLSSPGTGTGQAAVALSVTDQGGGAGTNGPQTVTKELAVLVRPDPVVDFVEEYNTPENAADLARFPETENAHFLSLPAAEPGALKIEVKKDFVWAGLWYQLPREIDLSSTLRISARMKASAPVVCRVFLMDHEKNYTSAAAGPSVEVGTGEFRDYLFEFRGNLAGSLGKPIDPSRLTRILFNFQPGKPFHGTVWLDDLRIGKSARAPKTTPAATVDPLPNLYLTPRSGPQRVGITGISDGFDGSREPKLTAETSDPQIVRDLKLQPGPFGTAELTFSPASVGVATIEVVAQCPDGAPGRSKFSVSVAEPGVPVKIEIDRSTRHQTIEGLGAYIASPGRSDISLTNPVRGAELARDLGMSMARLGIIEADWEPANDNANDEAAAFPMATDPAWLESARRLSRFKELSGVDRYIMSVWAPGAFSMKLKGRSCFGATSAAGNTDQHPFSLNPAYLEEFGEHLASWHHWLAERVGIEIYASSLGNEVQFTQPYPSAVYGIAYYHRVWTALGNRLEREGLPPWQFGAEVLPEQNEVLPYFRPILNDPAAAKFIKALAYHGYAGLGVNPGSNDAKKLESYYEAMRPLGHGVWMTETSGNTDDWKGAYELGEAMFACLVTGKNSAWVFWTFANNTDEGGYLLANRWLPGGRFYAVKQMMKHIRPGDTMVAAHASDNALEPAAFVSADGKRTVLILKNASSEMRPVLVPELGEAAAVYQSAEHRHHAFLGVVKSGGGLLLPPKSFTTLVAGGGSFAAAETPALYPRHASTGAPLRVQVTSPTDAAVIRYTTDGSEPTERSPIVSNPMILTQSTLLKTRAFYPGLPPSPIGGAYYKLGQ